MEASVWWTGMLPGWEPTLDGRMVVDLSALGAIDADGAIVRQGKSRPVMAPAGVPFAAADYLDDILAGFRRMHAKLTEILAKKGGAL